MPASPAPPPAALPDAGAAAPVAPVAVLIAGATGLVGSHVLRLALDDARVSRVVAPTRSPLPPHPRLHNPVGELSAFPADAPWWAVDAVVCALGTTMAKAGSRAAFRAVDLDLPLLVARRSRAHGARVCALNSALGADPKSMVFYSRTKGALEQALRAMAFVSLTLVRPGLIGGRRQESRPAEGVGIRVSRLLEPLLPRRYRVVPAERVAHHLLEAAIAGAPGVHVLESEALV